MAEYTVQARTPDMAILIARQLMAQRFSWSANSPRLKQFIWGVKQDGEEEGVSVVEDRLGNDPGMMVFHDEEGGNVNVHLLELKDGEQRKLTCKILMGDVQITLAGVAERLGEEEESA